MNPLIKYWQPDTPRNPNHGDMWMDTSGIKPVLFEWTGFIWRSKKITLEIQNNERDN